MAEDVKTGEKVGLKIESSNATFPQIMHEAKLLKLF